MDDHDLAAIELLCRLQLAANQVGCRIRIDQATDELRTTLTTAGLADVLLSGHPTDPTGAERASTTDRSDR